MEPALHLMPLAYPLQQFQDWFTQQWVLLWGKKVSAQNAPWLVGPFGNLHGIGNEFIRQLSEAEKLHIEPGTPTSGLLTSITQLRLPESQQARLSPAVIDFYEHTSDYELAFSVHWNPLFRPFGIWVNRLFSNRINQLNLPVRNTKVPEQLTSEIIHLTEPDSGKVRYTVWRRTQPATGKTVYLGLYGVCTLPDGQTAIKAVFPLPEGNATVILTPHVGEEGELVLDGSGNGFGSAGFYFLVRDTKGNTWAQYRKTFRDRLTLRPQTAGLAGEQVLTLWRQRVLTLHYAIHRKTDLVSSKAT